MEGFEPEEGQGPTYLSPGPFSCLVDRGLRDLGQGGRSPSLLAPRIIPGAMWKRLVASLWVWGPGAADAPGLARHKASCSHRLWLFLERLRSPVDRGSVSASPRP